MCRKILFVLFLLSSVLFGDFDYTVENTNITLSSDGNISLYNYNRLRLRSDYTQDNFFVTFIGDGINYLGADYVDSDTFSFIEKLRSNTPFKTQTTFKEYSKGSAYAKVYRAYGGYEDGQNRVVVGLQNINMGVGRIWTPTNLYNPKNSYALESDEVFGVAAMLYTRHLDDTSHITVVANQNADDALQYGARYKTYLNFADFALDLISLDDILMLGYELEANLADTGIEVRSEGVYIKTVLDSSSEDEIFYQGIVGADYGFENGVTLLVEALYSSQSFSYETIAENFDMQISSNLLYSNFYLGSSLSYSFNIFLSASLLYIESFNEQNSRFISPAIDYSFNDYNSFSLAAMLQDGSHHSEFGMIKNSYFFKYSLVF